ncbi:MAG: sulfatase [Nocardioidaceae bacterium]
MTRRRLIGLAGALFLCMLGLSALGQEYDAPTHGPNVVLVMTDDMRMDDLQYMPNTLHLLAEQGATFTQMLSPYPLCCPARAEVLSGQYAHNNGVQGNNWPRGGYYKLDNSNTLPVWLSAHGYLTGFMGKYLNEYGSRDPEEVPPGWDDWAGSLQHIYNYTNVVLSENGAVVPHPRVYQTDLFDHRSTGLVREFAGSDQPFFLWVSHIAPHAACSRAGVPTRQVTGRCWHPAVPQTADRGTFLDLTPLSDPSINEADMSDKSAFMQRLDRLTPAELAGQRFARIQRIEALQSVDRAVAHLVATLKATGEYRDTYIVFTSDNGIQLGEHRWRYKVLGYEPSVRVPLIIEGPGVPHGVVRQQAVTTVDMAATVADITGSAPGRVLDGQSVLPLATGSVPDVRDRIVPLEAGPLRHSTPRWLYQGVRTNRYTLLAWHNGDIELYDRQRDPYQVSSVDGDPTYAAVERDLLSSLRSLATCAGPACMAWVGGRSP